MSTTTALDPAAAIVAAGRELLEELQTLIDCGISDADQVPGVLDKLTALLRSTRGKVARRKPERKPAQASVKVAAVAAPAKPAAPTPAAEPKQLAVPPATKPAKVTVPIPARRTEPDRPAGPAKPKRQTQQPLVRPAARQARPHPTHHARIGRLLCRSVIRWAIVGLLILCIAIASEVGVAIQDIALAATITAGATITATAATLATTAYRRARERFRRRA